METKTCPRCSERFSCQGDGDCWCEGVEIHRASMVEIIERYPDCLCPDCLEVFRARE